VLASKGAGGANCKLSAAQLRELAALLDAGPTIWGGEDQCWTLARIAELVRPFTVDYTLAGLDLLLHQIGYSVQTPARQAAEGDQAAIATWREENWPVVRGRRRTWASGAQVCHMSEMKERTSPSDLANSRAKLRRLMRLASLAMTRSIAVTAFIAASSSVCMPRGRRCDRHRIGRPDTLIL
jgi:hypothetical protein